MKMNPSKKTQLPKLPLPVKKIPSRTEPVRLTLSLQPKLHRKFQLIAEQMGIETTAAIRFFALYGLQHSPLLRVVNQMDDDSLYEDEE